MVTYLFNPENDLALAAGTRSYTPPRNAALLARCGALLPLWLTTSRDDTVLAQHSDRQWIETIQQLFDPQGVVSAVAPAKSSGRPWGWSAAVVTEFVKKGIDRPCLPTDDAIERMRLLSHRRSSIIINRRLADLGFDTPRIAREVFDLKELETAAKAFDNLFVVKSPWSSTGRGVFTSTSVPPATFLKNAGGIINRQGSVIVEPLLDRKTDFAMLFHSENGCVKYRGLSLFDTLGTAYTGNLLLPEPILNQRIESQLKFPEQLKAVASALERILTEILGHDYEGWMGVDMMVYGDGRLAPCIELNLRMTMGVVAATLRDRWLAPGTTGRFTVEHGIFEPCDNLHAVIESNRLVGGSVDLVPPGQGFRIALNAVPD